MSKKLIFSSLVMMLWISGTGYAFWWFQVRDLRPFDLQAHQLIQEEDLSRSLDGLLAPLQPVANTAYLLHFWQPDCSCNQFNRSHVKTIAEKYQQKNFKLITITRSHPEYSDQQLTQMAKQQFDSIVIIDKHKLLSGKSRIPASPAAAVIDLNGKLAYFGPYSDSTFCGLGGTDFVERVADLLLSGENPSILNTMVFGCFCNWDTNKLQKT